MGWMTAAPGLHLIPRRYPGGTPGRQVYLQNGGVLGRPSGSNESESEFLKKENSQKIIKSLRKGLTIRETAKVAGVSTRTTLKVKKTAIKHGILEQ